MPKYYDNEFEDDFTPVRPEEERLAKKILFLLIGVSTLFFTAGMIFWGLFGNLIIEMFKP